MQVTKRAIRAINPNRDRPLHVSFDIDALDPTEAPATGTRGTCTLHNLITTCVPREPNFSFICYQCLEAYPCEREWLSWKSATALGA